MHMIIRPSDGKGLQALFAAGRFLEADGAFVIDKLGGAPPLGGTLCSVGSDYAVWVSPDGTGQSRLGPLDITAATGTGKAWYLRDVESGEIWSIGFSPLGERNTDVKVSYLPGCVTLSSRNSKIGAELTIAVVPDRTCEVWRIRIENRSAADRTLALTTYVEPCIGAGVETKYFEEEHALIARKSLRSHQIGNGPTGRDLVLFHSCTIAPAAFETEKANFVGGGTLRSPMVSGGGVEGRDGPVEEAVLSLTVNIDIPIEGEAEIGFCFGAAEHIDAAMDAVRSLGTVTWMNEAVDESTKHWGSLCSTLQVDTPDHVLNALVNQWLPYEAYAGWAAQRTGGVVFNPSQLADGLRRYYAITGAATGLARKNLARFAARMCASGAYSPDDDVQVVPAVGDMLWLAASAASYVAETGDIKALDVPIKGRDGIASSLKDECERAIASCRDGREQCEDTRLLDRTIRLWTRIYPDAARFSEMLTARRCDGLEDMPGDRSLPRRLGYLQSLCPTLSDPAVLDRIRLVHLDSESATGEMCGLYSALVEHVFGVTASLDGLVVRPTLPQDWDGFAMTRRLRGDTYKIRVRRSRDGKSGPSLIVDGAPLLSDTVPYSCDGCEHEVEITTA